MYLLDTNICIYIMKGHFPCLNEHIFSLLIQQMLPSHPLRFSNLSMELSRVTGERKRVGILNCFLLLS